MKELKSRLSTLQAEAGELATRLTDGSASDDDVTRANTVADEIGTVKQEIVDAEKEATDKATASRAARDRIAALVNGSNPDARSNGTSTATAVLDPETRSAEPPAQIRPRTAGERFAESDAFDAFMARGAMGNMSLDLDDVDARDFIHGRATIDNTTMPVGKTFVATIDPTPDRPLRIADLVDRQSTGLNSVPYLIEGANLGAAAEVAEGAAKPEATFTFTEDVAPVRTIAHWVPITRQAAEDNPTMVGYINGRLAYGLELRLDGQILAGNGTAPNIRGIINTSGVGTYTPGAAEARVITIRKAITIAQLAEYQPDAVVLHPNDWQSIELDQDTTGAWRVSQNVQNSLTPRIWGLNVVVTTAITTATYLVGAFKLGATLWERHGVRLLMSDSHASNFTSNILVLLAELRAALTVWRPAAFVKGGFV